MNLTLTDKLKLLSKGDISFLSRGFASPTTTGDHKFQIVTRQKPTISPCSHFNCLILQTLSGQVPVKCEVRWSRLNKQTEMEVGVGEYYQFQVDDIGWIIRAQVTHPSMGKGVVHLGPILIDPSLRILLEPNVSRGASKFSLVIRNITVHETNNVKISDMGGMNLACSVFLSGRQMRLVATYRAREVTGTLDYSLTNPQVLLDEDKQFTLRFLNDTMQDFIEQIQPHQYGQSLGYVEFRLEATSQTQRDLLLLTLRLGAAKLQVESNKFLEGVDKYLAEQKPLFANTPIEVNKLQLPGDLLNTITALGYQVQHVNTKNESLERDIIKAHLQVKQFEQEMEETIQSYQQVLAQNNIPNTKSLRTLGATLGSEPTLHAKMNLLRDQVELLQQQQACEPFRYANETKEQLIAKINDLDGKLAKSRRLNELLNQELKLGNNPQEEMLYLQAENQQLRLENDLVQVYHKQLMEQEVQLQELKQLYGSEPHNNEDLSQENQDLRRELESYKAQLYQQCDQSYQEPKPVDESMQERLQEQVNALQRKNDSLLKEIDLLIKSPNQIRILQQQAAQNQLDVAIRDLQAKVQRLEDENAQLRDQLETASRRSARPPTSRLFDASKLLEAPSAKQMDPASSKILERRSSRCSSIDSPVKRQRSQGSQHGIFDKRPPAHQRPNIPAKYELITPQTQPPTRRSKHELSQSQDYSQQDNSVIIQYEQLIRGSRNR